MSASRLDRALLSAGRWSARIGGLVIFACVLLVAGDVLLRNLPGGAPEGLRLHSFDLTNFGFAAATAFGFSYALVARAHIRIDILYTLFPLPVRAVLDLAAVASLAAMGSVMAWHAWGVVQASARLGATPNSTLDVPLAVPQALWAAGLTWFALTALLVTAQAVRRLATGQFRALHAAAGAGEAASEDGS
jgi:TRAP-type mannitol/chloroaromatic compound transport system permease small subunit